MKYRAHIDGLRAVAVLPAIPFHAGFSFFSDGYVGVDIFFVISGYLITTPLLGDLASDRFSIVHCYERGALRILPALSVVLLACLPFARMWLDEEELKDFSQSLVAVSFFSSNVLFCRSAGKDARSIMSPWKRIRPAFIKAPECMWSEAMTADWRCAQG